MRVRVKIFLFIAFLISIFFNFFFLSRLINTDDGLKGFNCSVCQDEGYTVPSKYKWVMSDGTVYCMCEYHFQVWKGLDKKTGGTK